ncbi:MAG TPA: alkaline phosphatase PhoX [Gemmatimonadaceae bacterium]|nr:alkaline phosphatase PhoX [Gemmatimonadaceae bacterium]
MTSFATASADREFHGGVFRFTPLSSSFACTVSGGDPVNPIALGAGLGQSIIASEPQFADAIDMNTQNENGIQRGRYLYRPSEGAISEVTVTDLKNIGPNSTKRFAFRADWESFDPIVWTPWGTILVAEEANVAAKPDPDVPQAKAGLVYELFPRKGDPSTLDKIVVRPAIGSKAHEGMRFDKQGNLYSISERNPGYIYKFTPDKKGDLSKGQLYVLKITRPTGDRTGEGEWIPLDRNAVQIDAAAAADAVGATGYNRPEDVESATSSGSFPGNVLFVAVTGRASPVDNRIIAIDLGGGDDDDRGERGKKESARPFVYDYVAPGLNTTLADFEMPDNVALDPQGNLYIAEDPGGNFATKKKGDDIWVARPGRGKHAPASSVERVGSLTDCDAEPTGIYWELGGNRLFVNVQHRGGDHLDKAVAIGRE